MCGFKWLLCGGAGASNCLRPRDCEILWHANVLCFFFVISFFFWQVCLHLVNIFFRCCYCNVFVLLLPLILPFHPFFPPDLPIEQTLYVKYSVISVFCCVVLALFIFYDKIFVLLFLLLVGDRILCPVASARFVRFSGVFCAVFFVLTFKWDNRDGTYFG